MMKRGTINHILNSIKRPLWKTALIIAIISFLLLIPFYSIDNAPIDTTLDITLAWDANKEPELAAKSFLPDLFKHNLIIESEQWLF